VTREEKRRGEFGITFRFEIWGYGSTLGHRNVTTETSFRPAKHGRWVPNAPLIADTVHARKCTPRHVACAIGVSDPGAWCRDHRYAAQPRTLAGQRAPAPIAKSSASRRARQSGSRGGSPDWCHPDSCRCLAYHPQMRSRPELVSTDKLPESTTIGRNAPHGDTGRFLGVCGTLPDSATMGAGGGRGSQGHHAKDTPSRWCETSGPSYIGKIEINGGTVCSTPVGEPPSSNRWSGMPSSNWGEGDAEPQKVRRRAWNGLCDDAVLGPGHEFDRAMTGPE
jgi:hypothetical protein